MNDSPERGQVIVSMQSSLWNPMSPVRFSPGAPVMILWRQRRVISQLVKREIAARYRGSMIGWLWMLVHPLLLLAVYTVVFSGIFKMKWGSQVDSHAQFATVVFAGLVVHGFFAECLGRAPGLVLANANYVKRVVFPLEVLPWICVLTALFHTAVNLAVLTVFVAIGSQHVPVTVLYVPLILLPLLMITVGATWFIAALGAYLRDIEQVIGLVITLFLFLSPVFYPLAAVPAEYRGIVAWNILTPIIESVRAVAVFGESPDWGRWAVLLLLGTVAAPAGLYWFQRLRRGFADVL
jgi:lipopolysaccharide transport system permease protein